MKIRNITLDDEETPETVTVEMTLAEAVWIAAAAGVQTPTNQVIESIYSALAGGLFNRYFDDGVNEAQEVVGLGHYEDDRAAQ